MTQRTSSWPCDVHVCPVARTAVTLRFRAPCRSGAAVTCPHCGVERVYAKPVPARTEIHGQRAGPREHFMLALVAAGLLVMAVACDRGGVSADCWQGCTERCEPERIAWLQADRVRQECVGTCQMDCEARAAEPAP